MDYGRFFDKKSSWTEGLYASHFETILGPMLALSDQRSLFLLEFIERKNLQREIKRLQLLKKGNILFEEAKPLSSIEKEINLYFEGKLTSFQTPIECIGTPFQKRVWEELQKIPFGRTISYRDVALRIGEPNAFRAAAGAVGANHFAVLIPCHRVIQSDGKMGGYAGGLARKSWLLDHEILNFIP